MSKQREYRKMMRKYKRAMRKSARECAPWDYSFGLDGFIIFLTWMRDYYKLGVNVMALDEPVTEKEKENFITRLQGLNMALQLYDMWQTADDKFFAYVTEDKVKEYTDKGWFCSGQSVNEPEIYCLRKYESFSQTAKEFNEYYTKCRMDFFTWVGEHISQWWD